MQKTLFFLLGITLSNTLIISISILQDIYLDNWSGIYPIYRILQLPIFIATSSFIGLLIVLLNKFFKIRNIQINKFYIQFGSLLGFVGLGSVIRPWLGSNQISDLLIWFLVFIFAFIFYLVKSIKLANKV